MSKPKLFAGILERTIDLRPRSRAESRRWTTLCHHQGLKQQGRYPQSLKVPATTLASGEFDRKLLKTISSKYLFLQTIQSTNFFQIYVNPKSFNHQISSKYLFLQNMIIFIIKFLPSICSSELFYHQISSKYMFLQNH